MGRIILIFLLCLAPVEIIVVKIPKCLIRMTAMKPVKTFVNTFMIRCVVIVEDLAVAIFNFNPSFMLNDFVELPIFVNYDSGSVPIGFVKMRKEDMQYLLPDMTIAPAFIDPPGEVIMFGLIETGGYCRKMTELNLKKDS